MKIIKSTEKEACKSMMKVEKKADQKDNGSGISKVISFFSENRRRALVIACSVVLIGGAIFLNWKLFGAAADMPVDSKGTQTPAFSEQTQTHASEKEETNETYFALAVIERQRARDEALQVLQTLVDSTDALSSEKVEAIDSISKIAEDIENEANIETLLKAKGFTDCIAVIDNGKATVIIGTDETLMANQIAQITEIVYTSAKIEPTNLTITERKG